MNVCTRLDQLFTSLQERDSAGASSLRTEIEMVFCSYGLSPSLMQFLFVLDRTPWRDYHNSSSHDYQMAGKQTLEELLQAAMLHRTQHPRSDLRPEECIRKIKEYLNSGHCEDFALKVQQLMINLDELIKNFPNRPNVSQPMESDLSVKEQIEDLRAFVTNRIMTLEEESRRIQEKHEEEKHTVQNMSGESRRQIELQYSCCFEDMVRDMRLRQERDIQSKKEQLKGCRQKFSRDAEGVFIILQNQIKDIINDIDSHRYNLKRGRVYQLKPVLPPMENLNELNRRCCEMFEFLSTLHDISNNNDVELHRKVTELRKELICNAFVVELQPPPVLKLESKGESGRVKTEKDGARKTRVKMEKEGKQENKHESKFFNIGVRILGAASFVGLQVAADQLKFTVHMEKEQIAQVMNSPGHVDKANCYCEVNIGTKKNDGNIIDPRSNFRRIFEKMKLVQVPKPEDGHRQLFENVTDKKCAIIMSVAISHVGVVKVLCEPTVLTTATVQTGPALGTIFWDAAFSQLKRDCYEEQDEVQWSQLAEEIQNLFNEYIPKRPLTEQQLHSIALHLFKEEGNNMRQNFTDRKLSRRDFMKEPKVEDSHWRWLFSCLNLIRPDPHDKNWEGLADYWQKGLILGFVTKKEAETIINRERPGTFLIRFRDTGIEKSNRDCPRASLSIVYRKSDDGKVLHVCDKLRATDIQGLNLGNCLQQFKNGASEGIQFLYPINKTFEEAFGEFIDEGSPDYGYARLLTILVPPDKNLNDQVIMGAEEVDQAMGCLKSDTRMNQEGHGVPQVIAGPVSYRNMFPNVSSPSQAMQMPDTYGGYAIASPASSEAFSQGSPQTQEMPKQMQQMTLSPQGSMVQSPEYYVPGSPSVCSVQSPGDVSAQSPNPGNPVSSGLILSHTTTGQMQGLNSMSPSHGIGHLQNHDSPQVMMDQSGYMTSGGITENGLPHTSTHFLSNGSPPGLMQNPALIKNKAQMPAQGSPQHYISFPNASPHQGSPLDMTQLSAAHSPHQFAQVAHSPNGDSVFVDDVMGQRINLVGEPFCDLDDIRLDQLPLF